MARAPRRVTPRDLSTVRSDGSDAAGRASQRQRLLNRACRLVRIPTTLLHSAGLEPRPAHESSGDHYGFIRTGCPASVREVVRGHRGPILTDGPIMDASQTSPPASNGPIVRLRERHPGLPARKPALIETDRRRYLWRRADMFRVAIRSTRVPCIGVSVVLLLLLVGTPALAAAPTTLSYADSSTLTVVFHGPSDTPAVLVAVQSTAFEPTDLVFAAVLHDGQTPVRGIIITGTPVSGSTSQVAWYSLTFGHDAGSGSMPGEVSGFLVMGTRDGSATAAVRPIMILTQNSVVATFDGALSGLLTRLPKGPGAVVLEGFLLALGLIIIRVVQAHGAQSGTLKIGTPKWSYDSWASTFTSVGAVLGVVLGGGILPESSILLTKPQLTGISVLCGTLVLTAPLLYVTWSRIEDGVDNRLPFFAAALLSFTGAFTELIALLIGLAGAADVAGSFALAAILTVACAALVLLTLAYGWYALAVAFPGGDRRPVRLASRRRFAGPARSVRMEPGYADEVAHWSMF